MAGAVADIFDALVSTLSDTRLEPDLEDLLWSAINLFHRSVERIERELDDNEQAQHRSQREQNGSEVQSVELERLTAEGITLIEHRNSMELGAALDGKEVAAVDQCGGEHAMADVRSRAAAATTAARAPNPTAAVPLVDAVRFGTICPLRAA